ncbi:hypothetical protein B0G84_5698 [Paraburkholderia sp. BL8N3]|nr:hypothetical protein [Paraburkholderia sp. BL8N3]TCK36685.1 hypothetical protein B0G84_5698 [Paraburkholderia sp. BL8N3]
MSKNSRLAHETIVVPDEVTEIDEFEPDYKSTCISCGETPTVLGIRHGKVIYASRMCGKCTWGDAEAADPANW